MDLALEDCSREINYIEGDIISFQNVIYSIHLRKQFYEHNDSKHISAA